MFDTHAKRKQIFKADVVKLNEVTLNINHTKTNISLVETWTIPYVESNGCIIRKLFWVTFSPNNKSEYVYLEMCIHMHSYRYIHAHIQTYTYTLLSQ